MKKLIFLTIFLFIFSCTTTKDVHKTISNETYENFEVNANSPEKVKNAVNTFDLFFKELSNELLTSLKNEGPVKTISICKQVSPNLEKKFSEKDNMKVYRISDRNRNPNHKPTVDEQAVLEIWEKRILEGKKISPVYYMTEHNKTKVMKPVKIMSELCLQCHGDPEKMNPDLKKAIQKEYPNDKAVNYKLDDLRGAFVAEF